jgi:hypothetical protein
MELSGDDLAGVVDALGALTRAELGRALAELAFKQGEETDPEEFDDLIDAAIDEYQLIRITGQSGEEDPLVIVGPSAFPTRPAGTQDLRHILDIDDREIDRERAGEAATDRLREEAALAIETGDTETIKTLIDVSYDIEAWAPVTLGEVRDHLDENR